MKKNKIMTVITVLLAIVIIIAGVGAVELYSNYRRQGNTEKVKQTRLSSASDVSFEKDFFDQEWENYRLENLETGKYPANYSKTIADILGTLQIATYGRQSFQHGKDEFIFIDQFRKGQVKSFFDQSKKRIDIKLNYHMTVEEKGDETKGCEYIEGQLEERKSPLHSMLNNVLKALQKYEIISNNQKVEFSSGSEFIHNKKIYIPFIAQKNYILFIYDYQIRKYCGIKIFFTE